MQSEDVINEKVDEEKPENIEGVETPVTNSAELPKVTYQEVAEVMQVVGQ